MKFADIYLAHLFWLLPGLILFYIWSGRRRKRRLARFVDKRLLPHLIPPLSQRRFALSALFMVAAVCLLVFCLMRPKWGFKWQEVKRRGLDILIAIDTSRSMLARDVRPNRLERCKWAVRDLVKRLDGDRVGLIAFAGSAFLQCPLTVDYNGFLLSLDEIDTEVIPKGGTSISQAITTAINSYEGGAKKYKVLIIITDGEDHRGRVMEAAEEAKKEGIKIFCIGIGTKQGELIPIVDAQGKETFLKDRQGRVVKTRLDEVTLQKIALNTDGSYVRARAGQFGLDLIYEQKLSKMEKRELKSKMVKHYEDRFQIPLALAIALLAAEAFL
ncbi:MAG: VWA domain-containing protein [Candidatus Omnitrophota bacterium]